MYLRVLTSFLAILIFVADQIRSQESPQGACQVWADPHLLMFPVDPAQQSLRMSYWCQTPGRMLILKNQYIEVYVNVTDTPYWNEGFEINLLSGPQTLCTITHNQYTCNSVLVDVDQINSGLDILYYNADNLSLTVNSYMIDNRNVYDIVVTQSYRITLESSGLCVTKSPNCRLENTVNPFGRRRKRKIDNKNATQVCDEYMKQAYRTAKDFLGNTGSSMAEHARAACIKDVSVTGNPLWGQSAINYVVMDALKQSELEPTMRREKLQTIIPAIVKAAARAREDSYHWMRPPPSQIILT